MIGDQNICFKIGNGGFDEVGFFPVLKTNSFSEAMIFDIGSETVWLVSK